MDFGVVEVEIAEYLIEKINDNSVNIIPIPEKEGEILPPPGKRQIIVAFAMEDSDPNNNVSFIQQDSNVTFTILLQGKLLRGETGLYKLAERVKSALQGFTPTDGREMSFINHKFIKNEKGVFEYALDFKTETTRVADKMEPAAGATLTQTTFYTNEKV